ncbi:NAD(P)-binding domain [Phytophthora cactorum]|nr:NAD(P)-binding domain [Phytophthora cactorum]
MSALPSHDFRDDHEDSLMQQLEVNAKLCAQSPVVGSISHNKEETRTWFVVTMATSRPSGMTRSLILDVRERNIIVVAANPGLVDTEMNNHSVR